MKFNENLKYLRKKEGLTQEELAEKLNVSRQSVTKWESGISIYIDATTGLIIGGEAYGD